MAEAPEAIHRAFEKAFNDGDVEALVRLYEPGAVINFGGPVHGLEAIAEAYRGFLAGKPVIRVETLSSLEAGEGLALLHGSWKLKGTGPDGAAFENEGRNTEVVRRQADGSWRFVLDNPYTP